MFSTPAFRSLARALLRLVFGVGWLLAAVSTVLIEDRQLVADDSQPADATIVANDDPEIEYDGTVLDSDKRPIANADIWFASEIYDSLEPAELGHKVAVSDAEGKFSFRLKSSVIYRERRPKRLTARADGFGCDWMPLGSFESNASGKYLQARQDIDRLAGQGRFASRTLILPAEAGPVKGRLVDLEGRPLPDVTVKVESITRVDRKLLEEAFQAKSRDLANQATRTYGGSISAGDWQLIFPPLKTDKNGEFLWKGLGRDQQAVLILSDERVSADRISVIGAEMKPNALPQIRNGAQDAYFGTQFTYPVGPSVPIVGTVTEFPSGRPIAGATVFIERLFQSTGINGNSQLRLLTQHIRTVTDENGHYRLIGVPPGGKHTIQTRTNLTEPWLDAEQEFSIDATQKVMTVNMQVFRGIWIDVNVTDADTKEPISGSVDYLALRSNPNTPQAFGLRDAWRQQRFRMQEPGKARVVGLPGPGVLLVRSIGKTNYPLQAGAEKVDGYDARRRILPTTPRTPTLANWNQIQQIDPPVGTATCSFDIVLSAGRSVKGRIVRPDGISMEMITASGLVEKSNFNYQAPDDIFVVSQYDPTVPRDILFASRDGLLAGHLHLEGEPPPDLVVALQPAVTVRGRLIETETDTAAARYRLLCLSTKLGSFYVGDSTDANGKFVLKGLLAGNIYSMDSFNPQQYQSGKNRFAIDLSNAKPGDVIELGDVTGKNAKPPQAVPAP